jgi:hypothetical protein
VCFFFAYGHCLWTYGGVFTRVSRAMPLMGMPLCRSRISWLIGLLLIDVSFTNLHLIGLLLIGLVFAGLVLTGLLLIHVSLGACIAQTCISKAYIHLIDLHLIGAYCEGIKVR